MQCRRAIVGSSHAASPHTWYCHLLGEEPAVNSTRPQPPTIHQHKENSCQLGADSTQPECLVALLAARNQRLNAGPFGESNASVHFVGVARLVERGLPGAQAAERFLTFVQGHRQTAEYSLQAAAFALSRAAALVSESDLLVHCNNPSMHASTLLRHLVRYPHRTVSLLHTHDNSFGYRCGHLHAVESTRFVWDSYHRGVIFLHPDVFLLPRAVRWLSDALHDAAGNTTALLVTRLTPRHVRNANGTRLFKVAGGTFSTVGAQLLSWETHPSAPAGMMERPAHLRRHTHISLWLPCTHNYHWSPCHAMLMGFTSSRAPSRARPCSILQSELQDLFAFLPHRFVSNASRATAAIPAATSSTSLSIAQGGSNATLPSPSLETHPADVVWRDVCRVPPHEHVVWPERCLWRMGEHSRMGESPRLIIYMDRLLLAHALAVAPHALAVAPHALAAASYSLIPAPNATPKLLDSLCDTQRHPAVPTQWSTTSCQPACLAPVQRPSPSPTLLGYGTRMSLRASPGSSTS